MEDFLQTDSRPQATSKWRIFAIGLGLVVAVTAAGFFLIRGDHAPEPTAPDAYAARVQISDIKMSSAENLVGGAVTYIEGAITNHGDKTVTDARVEATFLSTMNDVAQKEQTGLHIIRNNGVYDDAVEFSNAPLGPGQSARFRLAFEHISAQWNQSPPDIHVLRVATK